MWCDSSPCSLHVISCDPGPGCPGHIGATLGAYDELSAERLRASHIPAHKPVTCGIANAPSSREFQRSSPGGRILSIHTSAREADGSAPPTSALSHSSNERPSGFAPRQRSRTHRQGALKAMLRTDVTVYWVQLISYVRNGHQRRRGPRNVRARARWTSLVRLQHLLRSLLTTARLLSTRVHSGAPSAAHQR
ncbi:hypothetical protein HPB50_008704 [Hyalomma asiaticum]|uniref:Uncharacterized protein n=1 Tax=Hyalomma asiaticum TaxID=266040 RepID=A0ACB7SJ42_HYAAI|nr:hypothetical protein HPB50_008704 [Hyalomma asiaticum]